MFSIFSQFLLWQYKIFYHLSSNNYCKQSFFFPLKEVLCKVPVQIAEWIIRDMVYDILYLQWIS